MISSIQLLIIEHVNCRFTNREEEKEKYFLSKCQSDKMFFLFYYEYLVIKTGLELRRKVFER